MKSDPLKWLTEALLTLSVIPVLAMMVQVTLDVFLKYVFRHPIQGTLEVTAYYYMVAVVVLPLAFVEMTRQSIAVDLFFQMMGHRLRVVVTAFCLILSFVGYGGLAWISAYDAIDAFEKREIVMGTVPIYIWPTRFFLPIAGALTAIVCLAHLYWLFTSAAARQELTADPVIDTHAEVD